MKWFSYIKQPHTERIGGCYHSASLCLHGATGLKQQVDSLPLPLALTSPLQTRRSHQLWRRRCFQSKLRLDTGLARSPRSQHIALLPFPTPSNLPWGPSADDSAIPGLNALLGQVCASGGRNKLERGDGAKASAGVRVTVTVSAPPLLSPLPRLAGRWEQVQSCVSCQQGKLIDLLPSKGPQ